MRVNPRSPRLPGRIAWSGSYPRRGPREIDPLNRGIQPRNTQMREGRSSDSSCEILSRSSLSRYAWLNSAAILGARREISKESVEHLPDFDHLAGEGQGLRTADSDDLTPKRRVLRSSDLAGDPVSIKRHRMRLLPDLELLEIGHAVGLRGGGSQTSPFRGAEVLNATPTSERALTLATRIYASAVSHLCRSRLKTAALRRRDTGGTPFMPWLLGTPNSAARPNPDNSRPSRRATTTRWR